MKTIWKNMKELSRQTIEEDTKQTRIQEDTTPFQMEQI